MDEEQEQYQPSDIPFKYTLPPNDLETEGGLKLQLNSEDIIEDIKYTLLGYMKIVNKVGKEEWVPSPTSRPLINEMGMGYIEVVLRSCLTRIFKLTILDEEVIYKMTLSVVTAVCDNIFESYNEFGIRNQSEASTIAVLIGNTIFATLSAAKNGEFLLFLKTTHRIHETQTINQGIPNRMMMPQQPQRKTLLQRFLPFN